MHFFDQLTFWLVQLEEPVQKAVENLPKEEAQGSPFGLGFFVPMMLALAVMLLLMRPRKGDQEQKKRLAAIKVNDRVVTAGGIKGTIVSIAEENDFLTIRIDESTNTKIQVLKSSIIQIVEDNKKPS